MEGQNKAQASPDERGKTGRKIVGSKTTTGLKITKYCIFSPGVRCFSFFILYLCAMEKIIGRKEEFAKLSKFMTSDKGEFVAVYGRRRVGKTFLIRQYFKDKFDFYVTGIIDGSRDEEMAVFNEALIEYGHKGAKAKTWMEAFGFLANLLQSKEGNDW